MTMKAAGLVAPGWLVELLRRGGGALPPFLTPVPAGTRVSLAEELPALREVCAADVRADLERWYPARRPPALDPLWRDPVTALGQLSVLLERYWELVLEPIASTMHAIMEEEIFLRSRTLAMEGAEQLLATLHPGLSCEGTVLRVAATPGLELDRPARRILLVPLLLSQGAPLLAVGRDDVVALSYGARGAAVLAGMLGDTRRSDAPVQGDRLEILLGRSRAAMVRGLAAPTTTSALASDLGLAVSTVSEHLATLSAAGLVQRHRVGVRVFYELDRAGTALLSSLDGDVAAPIGRPAAA
ncbi:winged helix-turn-helix domain-containing protein [Catellatospora sp. NPDC049111]|uniref:ArsR/SmtB family transcription factor n=1 Tax=Catellatospora sp. NPDC049111 TaxID=3155271 RepID=UPI0033E9AD08